MSLPNEVISALLGGSAAAGGYQIQRSLRFNSSDSAYCGRTFGTATSRRTWTWAGWVKRAKLSEYVRLFNNTASGNAAIQFMDSDKLRFFDTSISLDIQTTQVFRDASAWYHLVIVLDTVQGTSSDRAKIYVNGVQITTFSTSTYPSQNADAGINNNNAHQIGTLGGSSEFFNGYLADIHFIDGQALDPSSFGEFDDNGVWQPIDASGLTYGTNGFRLPFSDNSTAAALGTDTSGNGHTWTVNNIAVGGAQPVTVTLTSTSGNDSQANIDNLFDGNTSTPMVLVGNTGTTSTCTFTPYLAVTSGRLYTTGGSASNKTIVTDVGNISVSSTGWTSLGSATKIYNFSAVMQPGDGGWYVSAIESNSSILTSPGSVSGAAGNDSLVDSPVNGSQVDTGAGGEVVGNYCTWNPLAKGANVSLSNGNLDASTSTTSGYGTVLGTVGMSSGKWYWEFTGGTGTLGVGLGIAEGSKNLATYLGTDVGYEYYSENGNKYSSAGGAAYGSSWGSGDVIGVTFDADAGTLSFYKNGVSQGTAYTGLTNTPYFPAVADSSGTNVLNGFVNFGQRQWAYAAPAGFKALCTTNLPEPTIADGSTAMDVVTYTGNGSTQTISGLNFSPDFGWFKRRGPSAASHFLFDQVRGAGKFLVSNTTAAEGNDSVNTLQSFDSTGYTMGNTGAMNESGSTYVVWSWDAGNSTVTNTEGSISSQVRANASAGFAVITGSTPSTNINFTFGHELGVAPSLVIYKHTAVSGNWQTYHRSGGGNNYNLNGTAGPANSGTWSGLDPTSTLITIPSGIVSANSSAFVCYAFSPVAGYSSMGSWTAAAPPVFVYTGFRPAFLLAKSTTTANPWYIRDNKRSAVGNGNPTQYTLFPNNSDAERDDFFDYIDFVSNGFVIRAGSGGFTNAGTVIYYAVAESPFAYSRAR